MDAAKEVEEISFMASFASTVSAPLDFTVFPLPKYAWVFVTTTAESTVAPTDAPPLPVAPMT